MSVTQEAVNLLVWRYMKESGFEHAAFVFESESQIDTSSIEVQQIPSVALVTYLQKALRYMGNEKLVVHARQCPESSEFKTIAELERRFPEPAPAAEDGVQEMSRSDVVQLSPAVATVLAAHRLTVYCCRFAPRGGTLATASSDGTVILWEMKEASVVSQSVLGEATDYSAALRDVSCIDWSPDGQLLAAGSFDSGVRVYRNTGKQEAQLEGHTEYVFVVKFNRSGTRVVTASSDKTVILWALPGFARVNTFNFHTDTVGDVSWRDDEVFATASADSTIGICNVNGSVTRRVGHNGDVHVVAYNNSGSVLASGGQDGIVRLWRGDSTEPVPLAGHADGISCMQWLPNNESILISGSVDGTIRVWDATRAFCARVIEQHTAAVYSLTISPDGHYVASGAKDQCVVLANIETGEYVARFSGNSDVYDVSFDPTGRFVAAAFEDATAVVIPAHLYML